LNSPNQEQEEVTAMPSQQSGTRHVAGKPRSIQNCNFRLAGRLSNEDTRSLTAIHETLARILSGALDAYLGTALEVKLQSLDRLPLKDHLASLPAQSYIMPFSQSAMSSTMVVECDLELVFPIIELLLGGEGNARGDDRELSEIDEEIMHDVFQLIVRQAELVWHLPELSLVAKRRIKSSALPQYCPPNEKVTVVRFEAAIAGISGSFQFVLPTAFGAVLLKQLKLSQPQKKSGVRFFPTPPIRERILDCDMEVAAELSGLKVAVRDLVALQPGTVLKLRAPVHAPGMLTAGGRGLFEAVPVRNGMQRAAQLGRRASTTNWKRG
jgi:flagellar motor switch protein FliM